MQIAIIKTATANFASVLAAFKRLQVPGRIVSKPSELTASDAVVLPGVGSFAAGMKSLTDGGWQDVLLQRFEKEQPTLAICLGLQMLCRSSAEFPGIRGLEVIPGDVCPLPCDVVVPHFGWNSIESSDPFFGSDYVYYANSFAVLDPLEAADAGWEIASTTHGSTFLAAAKRGSFVACQFHPELSGQFGENLLSRWLALAERSLSPGSLEETC